MKFKYFVHFWTMNERFQYMIQNTKYQFSDGSTGYLNSGSKLKFPFQFSYDRSVKLTGEAIFEVVRNEVFPFDVFTQNLDIKVLGNTFNVIANQD